MIQKQYYIEYERKYELNFKNEKKKMIEKNGNDYKNALALNEVTFNGIAHRVTLTMGSCTFRNAWPSNACVHRINRLCHLNGKIGKICFNSLKN